MKIDKIALYNFNSYEGWNEFDFTSDDSNKNIILIGGKNGAGKTSLFTAIKIALYGPLAFGYVGVNPQYIAKIKKCINSKAFQKDTVEAKVQISIALMIEREIKKYKITREWNYTKRKLEETYYVESEGCRLDEQELSYFQNYLQGMIPPDLFEFFLFDGEEVGNIFSTNTYNTYVKNAVYTLCGLDLFEIIRKYMKGYAGKAANKGEKKLHAEYNEQRKKADKLEVQCSELEERLATQRIELEKIETDLIEIETAFKNAGGITEVERQALLKELSEEEHIKTEALVKIKMFVEGLMPFFILKDFTKGISEQLDFEEKSEIYDYVQQKLEKQEIKDILNRNQKVSDETVDALNAYLLKKFMPNGWKEGRKSIHDLSKEDLSRVNGMISDIRHFNVTDLIDLVEKRKNAAERTAEINRILRTAMMDEDAVKFAEKENALLRKKDEISTKIHEAEMQLTARKEELTETIQQKEKALQTVKENAQNKNIFKLSNGLTQIMSSMLEQKSEAIKKNLEKLIVQNLQHIYRKNNLITHIEIEDNFQFNLYQNVQYSTTELLHLIKNLGKEAFSSEIGKQGMQDLYQKYEVENVSQLQQELEADEADRQQELFKRVDLSRLSKGERQIFILSLYWAIIELSGQDIPFVIDTPYARIDANHRKEISEKFFPNISRQVVILSTDEEINEEYYEIIKPHIAKEYLLVNDESQNRTTVEEHYFFEG